jgi:hypothetical protein
MKFVTKLFITAALLVTFCYGVVPVAKKNVNHASMHAIDLVNDTEESYCTATAIAPHVLLTAAHCDLNDSKITIDSEKTSYTIIKKVYDNYDHMLLVVPNVNFKIYIHYDPEFPMQSDHVYFWGNPEQITDQYREGYIMGILVDPNFDRAGVKGVAFTFLMTVFPGDSGSAIYGSDGRIVSIVTAGKSGITIGFPLKFTKEQIADAEK